jgi:hypothetical protein
MGSEGARIFVPPFKNPVNPNVDPMIWELIDHGLEFWHERLVAKEEDPRIAARRRWSGVVAVLLWYGGCCYNTYPSPPESEVANGWAPSGRKYPGRRSEMYSNKVIAIARKLVILMNRISITQEIHEPLRGVGVKSTAASQTIL